MNIRLLKHLGVIAALVGSVMSVSVANAAIVEGSKAQIFGTAFIDGIGNVIPLDEVSGAISPSPVSVLVGAGGNTLSYAGYNRPNPGSLAFAPNYTAGMYQIPAAGPFGFTLLALPAVVSGVGEPGPSVIPTFFVLDSWTPTINGSFFTAIGLGTIVDGLGGFLSNGRFEFSSQSFAIGTNSFSGTLIATSVIPVPGAMWIFGSGLLLMTAVMRRKVK
ncbi:MAG: hypothetical protein ACK515_23700 [bacterium]|jgi:hypothetical protein|nr:hypothetical protein [Betaproteobacteria bacterium]